jgi:hypothetical protein
MSDNNPKSFPPLNKVTMYQARCTTCGYIETDYGDFSAWEQPDIPVTDVVENIGWFVRYDNSFDPVELLCLDCQSCEVCGSDRAYEHDDHLVCDEHEGHDFAVVTK